MRIWYQSYVDEPNAVLETADYDYMLEKGKITHQDASAALAHDPRVVATYLGGTA